MHPLKSSSNFWTIENGKRGGTEQNRKYNLWGHNHSNKVFEKKSLHSIYYLLSLLTTSFHEKTNLVLNFHDFLTNIVLLRWSLVEKHHEISYSELVFHKRVCGKLEIVMNEMRKLKMSADFFANTSHDICRCLEV